MSWHKPGFLSGSLNAVARGQRVLLLNIAEIHSIFCISKRINCKKNTLSVLYLQTLQELGKVHRSMKYFQLEGIDIFNFLAGFCHVEFPEYLTLLNKRSNLPYARKVCFGSFLSREMFTCLQSSQYSPLRYKVCIILLRRSISY